MRRARTQFGKTQNAKRQTKYQIYRISNSIFHLHKHRNKIKGPNRQKQTSKNQRVTERKKERERTRV